MSKIIKNNNILTRYDKLPWHVEKEYLRLPGRCYRKHVELYSFNKTVGPIMFEDKLYLKIIRLPGMQVNKSNIWWGDLKWKLRWFSEVIKYIIIIIFIIVFKICFPILRRYFALG